MFSSSLNLVLAELLKVCGLEIPGVEKAQGEFQLEFFS